MGGSISHLVEFDAGRFKAVSDNHLRSLDYLLRKNAVAELKHVHFLEQILLPGEMLL